MDSPLTIQSLEIENTKRVKAVSLTPSKDGLTVIGGKNGNGKTSILDSIVWALGGDKHRPSNPKNDAWDSSTVQKVKNWQAKEGIYWNPDGVIRKESWSKILK